MMRVKNTWGGDFYFRFETTYAGESEADGKRALMKGISGGVEIRCGSGRVSILKSGSGCESALVKWIGRFEDEVVISWYFPGVRDLEGNIIGHYYENFFNSCSEVADYVTKNEEYLKEKTLAFSRSIYYNELPSFIKDAYAAQLSNLLKESCLTKDGKFGVWEGSPCCCGLQTTDVAFYGSWLYVNLFPELEKSGITLTSFFQREDG